MVNQKKIIIRLLIVVSCLFLFVSQVCATDYYVDASSGDDTNAGGVGDPWKTISHALTQVTTGDVVSVSEGLYNTTLGESYPLAIPSGVWLKSVASPSILATLEAGSVGGNNAIVLAPSSTLEGFYITATTTNANNHAVEVGVSSQVLDNTIVAINGSIVVNGAGALISGNNITSNGNNNSTQAVRITKRSYIYNNTVTHNGDSSVGINVLGDADVTTIEANVLSSTGWTGICIRAENSADDLLVMNNTVQVDGAGGSKGIEMSSNNNQHRIIKNIIRSDGDGSVGISISPWNETGFVTSNEVYNFTTGIHTRVLSSYITTINYNTLVANDTGINVENDGTGQTDIVNSIIAYDPDGGTSTGKGVDNNGGVANVSYCNVYGNATDYEGTIGDMTGTISATANFVDPANNDYHLLYTSPCIDTGTPAGSDMGAYNYGDLADNLDLIVTAPDGGESWTALTSQNITWTSTVAGRTIDHVNIHYSTDSGLTYPNTIATNQADDGSYSWSIPNDGSSTAKVRIQIVDTSGGVATDESNSDFEIVAAAPQVDSVSPSNGSNIESLTGVVIAGNYFDSGATVKLSKSGESDINASNVSFVDQTQLTCDFDLDLDGAAIGQWNLTVTNSDAQADTLSNGFTISIPAPIIAIATPESATEAGGIGVVLSGNNFQKPYYQRAITVTNSGSELTNFQVSVEVDTATPIAAGKMQADGDDIRIYDSDQTTLLSYWIESGLNSSSTVIWVKIPTISNGGNTIYMTYGDDSLAGVSNASAVFDFFDDMEDWSGWTTYSSGNVNQSATEAYDGSYSAYKTDNGDPNGAYKDIGSTLERDIILECWVYRESEGNQERVGVIDDSGNGYGWAYAHDLDAVGLDVRSSYSATQTTDSATEALAQWVKAQLVIPASATIYGNRYVGGSLSGALSISDSSYSSFTRVYIFGGFPYYVDQMRIRKYAASFPTVSVGSETYEDLAVNFGGTAATNVAYVDINTITATAPAHAKGAVDIEVLNPNGEIGTLEASFTYTETSGPTLEITAPNGAEFVLGNNNYSLTFTATDESGLKADTLNIYYSLDDGATYTSVATNQSATSPYSWAVPAGINTTEAKVKIEMQDAYDNLGTDESDAKFIIDSTGPTISLTGPDGGEKVESGGATYDIEWSASDNLSSSGNITIDLDYSVDGGATWTSIAAGEGNDGSYTWTTPTVDTTEAMVRVVAQDQAGNNNNDSSTSNFILDSTAASQPSPAYPTTGAVTSDVTPTYTWVAASDDISGVLSYEVRVDGTILTTLGAVTEYSQATNLSDGSHSWEIRAKNGVNIWSNYTSAQTFTVDTAAPAFDSITLRDGLRGDDNYTSTLTVTISAIGVSGSPSEMRLAENETFTTNSTDWQAYEETTIFTLEAGQGTREVFYQLRDPALNTSEVKSDTIIVDTISPVIQAITLSDTTSGSNTESNSYAVSVEASGVSTEAVQMRLAEDSSFSQNDSGWINYEVASEFTFSGSDGPKTLYFIVRDLAENESNTVSAEINVDTDTPTAESITLRSISNLGSDYTTSQTISVEISSVVGSPTEMQLAEDNTFNSNATAWKTFSTTTIFTLEAGEGTRSLYLRLRDAALNISPVYSDDIVLDTVNPTAPGLTEPANQTYISEVLPIFSWQAVTEQTSGVSTYEVRIDGNTNITTETSYFPATNLTDGIHNWEVRAFDNAGNTGNFSSSYVFTVDITSPSAVSLIAPVDSYSSNESSQLFIWSAATDAISGVLSYEVRVDGTSYLTTETSYQIDLLSEGIHTWEVRAQDLALNWGDYSGSYRFNLDTASPILGSIILADPSSGNRSYTNQTTVSWLLSNISAEVTEIIISSEADFAGASWQTYSTSGEIELASSDGLKTIYCKGRDSVFNESNIVEASILLDTVAPTIEGLVAPLHNTTTTDATPTFIWQTATDEGSGVMSYEVTINSTTIVATTSASSYTPALNFPDGVYTWEVRALDRALNWGSKTASWTIVIDTATPEIETVVASNESGETSQEVTDVRVAIDSSIVINFNKPMDPNSVEQAFTLQKVVSASNISAQTVPGQYNWSNNYMKLEFTPQTPFEANTTYKVVLAAGARDQNGNELPETVVKQFTTAAPSDAVAPTITLSINGQALWNNDYIPIRPTVEVLVNDETAIESSGVSMLLDQMLVALTVVSSTSSSVNLRYRITSDLSTESASTHIIRVQAIDSAGNITTKEVTGLKVSDSSTKAEVKGYVMVYPQTASFVPQAGSASVMATSGVKIAYNLNKSVDTAIYLISKHGVVHWTSKVVAGQTGAKAGYNEVIFNGVSDITRTYVPNGIYLVKIVAEGRVIGSGHLMVID